MACQCLQWPVKTFRKSLQIWNLLRSVVGCIRLTCLRWIKCTCTRTMNNTFSMYQYCLFYWIRRYGSQLTICWGTSLNNLFLVHWHWLSWTVHLAQWAQYHQINLSFYLLNLTLKYPSSQINYPFKLKIF